MEPTHLFEAFQLDNLEFLAKPRNPGTKYGWNKKTNLFYLTASTIASNGISKTDYFGFGDYFQRAIQVSSRITCDVENSSADVVEKIYEVLKSLDEALTELDFNINTPEKNSAYFDKLSLKQTAEKLKKISIALPQVCSQLESYAQDLSTDETKQTTLEQLKMHSEYAVKQKENVESILKRALSSLSENECLALEANPDFFRSVLVTPSSQDSFWNKTSAALNTGYLLVNNFIGTKVALPEAKDYEGAALQKIRQVLENPSSQLLSQITHRFILDINEKRKEKGLAPVREIIEFYFMTNASINQYTFLDIKNIIDAALKDSEEGPIVIPVVYSGYGAFERNHIATILVHNNIVEFFEPKGDLQGNNPSAKWKLASDATLRDVLRYCREKYTKEGKIIENIKKLQHDANNCGVLGCNFLKRRLIDDEPMGIQPDEISYEELCITRKEIFEANRKIILNEIDEAQRAYQIQNDQLFDSSDFEII